MNYIACIDGLWYAFLADLEIREVYSIGDDKPPAGGYWTGSLTEAGVKFVASPSPSRYDAYRKAKKYGLYGGVLQL